MRCKRNKYSYKTQPCIATNHFVVLDRTMDIISTIHVSILHLHFKIDTHINRHRIAISRDYYAEDRGFESHGEHMIFLSYVCIK